MQYGRRCRWMALASTLALVAVGCTGGGPRPSRSPSTAGFLPNRTGQPRPLAGGSVLFGAEQWPECLNPITSCGADRWTWYSVLEHVLPRAMQLDAAGNFIASPMLMEAPTLENGGLTWDPFTIRFRISDAAVWEDGTPITSEDFSFTWRAMVSTRNAHDMEAYNLIESIDATDPKVAVVRFSEPYAPWPELFGGSSGFVLKAAAFRTEVRQDAPDLSDQMLDSIPFSGGPWILQSWSQDQAILVRNEQYFGPKPILDQVSFVPRPDQATAIQSGQIQAISPSAEDLPLLDTTGAVAAQGVDGLALETAMFNVRSAPLDDPLVRQAVLFALDRQAVVDELASLNNPQAEVVNCGLVAVPQLGPWCRTRPFERYTYDPARARELLDKAGYDCFATPCTKDGRKLRIEITARATNTLRTSSENILVAGALDAGIEVRVKNIESLIFGDLSCPFGFAQISLCPLLAEPDPTVTGMFACDHVGAPTSQVAEHNWSGWCNPKADLLMKAADRALDPARRADLMDQVYRLQAEDAIGVPLFARPAVSMWRADQIAGPIGLWNGTPYGLFFNMNEWYMVQ